MKRFELCLFLLLLLCSGLGYAQQEIEISGLGGTFIVVGSIATELKQGKCPCSIPKAGKCALYEFKVLEVLECFPNHVFTPAQIALVDKILVSKNVKLLPGVQYTMLLQPGTSNSYLQYTDTLSINRSQGFNVKHLDGYVSDLIKCKGGDDFFAGYLRSPIAGSYKSCVESGDSKPPLTYISIELEINGKFTYVENDDTGPLRGCKGQWWLTDDHIYFTLDNPQNSKPSFIDTVIMSSTKKSDGLNRIWLYDMGKEKSILTGAFLRTQGMDHVMGIGEPIEIDNRIDSIQIRYLSDEVSYLIPHKKEIDTYSIYIKWERPDNYNTLRSLPFNKLRSENGRLVGSKFCFER